MPHCRPSSNDWSSVEFVLVGIHRLKSKTSQVQHKRIFEKLKELSPTPGQVDEETITKLVEWAQQGRRPATVNQFLRVARAQCRKLVKKRLLDVSPFDMENFFQREPKHKCGKHHSQAEISLVMAQADKEADLGGTDPTELPRRRCELWKANRMRALVYFGVFTGARRDEALWMRWQDLDLDNCFAEITGAEHRLKTTGSEALLPLAAKAAEALKTWRSICGGGKYVFPCVRKDRPWTGGNSGDRPLGRLKALGERAGVKGLTFQSLRCSLATAMEDWGFSELQIQRILRHTNPLTQEHYRQRDKANLRRMADLFSFRPEEGNEKRAA